MPFWGGQTRVGPTNHFLDGCTYGRQLANAIERSVLGSDAGCRYHYCSNLFITNHYVAQIMQLVRYVCVRV